MLPPPNSPTRLPSSSTNHGCPRGQLSTTKRAAGLSRPGQEAEVGALGLSPSCCAHARYCPPRASPELACFPGNVSCAQDVDSPVAHCGAVWILMVAGEALPAFEVLLLFCLLHLSVRGEGRVSNCRREFAVSSANLPGFASYDMRLFTPGNPAMWRLGTLWL